MMICGSSFQALLQTFPIIYGPTEVPPIRWVSILIPSTLIILPLSLLPSMAALAATSTLALAVYCFNIASVASQFIRSAGSRAPDVPIIPTHAEAYHWKLEAIKAIPIMIFAYQCHVQSVPIFAEMTPAASLFSCCSSTDSDGERSQIAATAKRRRVLPVFMVAFAQCTVMYTVMGVTGYLLFPVNTQSNILNNFDIDNVLMFVVRMLVGFAVALHYPIDLHVARTAMYDLVCGCLGKVPVYPAPYVSLAQCTVAIWGGSLVLACLVTDLGVVFQVLGGVACTLLIFILPGLMLLFDGLGNNHASVSAHNHVRDSEQDSREGEAPVDEVPLIPSSTGVCTSAPGDGTTQEEVRSPNNGDVGVRTEVDERGDAVVRLVDGVHEDMRWWGSGAAGNDCGTKVLGWSLVAFGSCVMLLTVYLTVFGLWMTSVRGYSYVHTLVLL